MDLSKEEFLAWRANPATRKIRQYFQDNRRFIMENWAAGAEKRPEAQIYAQMYGDFANLEYEDIKTFYEVDDEPS